MLNCMKDLLIFDQEIIFFHRFHTIREIRLWFQLLSEKWNFFPFRLVAQFELFRPSVWKRMYTQIVLDFFICDHKFLFSFRFTQ